ncbi:hypothetical protein, partial [Bacteroides sp.]|uniref:hypothetical protein n=1 Tax=Bacteroides sp. TaxID=29523 RepID=UPI0026390619
MIKFTNFRTKALALVAMTAFSAGSVFGQNADLSIMTSQKIIQWDGTQKQTAPVSSGDLVPGVSLSVTEGNWANEFDLPKSTTIQTTNPSTSTYWINGNDLNVFVGEGNKLAVTFDISAKYLKNVKDLQIELASNHFGGASNMSVNFDARVWVFDLAGNEVDYSTIYENGTSDWGTFNDVYNTNTASKTIKLFQEANDLTEDNKFIPNSLDNKLIRVTLISDLPVGEDGDHFPAALVVKSVKIQSDAPSITLTPSKSDFEAGMGYQTSLTGSSLAISSTLADGSVIYLGAPTNFVFNNQNDAKSVTLPANAQPFAFKPMTIDKIVGSFKAKLSATTDRLNPIKNIPVVTTAVTGNSVPELYLSENKLTFQTNMVPKTVQIWGKNIPKPSLYGNPSFEAAWFTTDQDRSSYSETAVNNNQFHVDDLGIIVKNSSNKLVINYAEIVNNIDFNPTVYVKINHRYRMHNKIKGLTTFTGGQEDPSIGLKKYPQILVVGDIAAVWFEYEGQDSKAGDIVGDISTAFYAPYDASKQDQVYSRTKKFILKGTKVEPDDGQDYATFKISLAKLETHDNDGHMAFSYSVDKGITWNTPVTTAEIKVAMLTPTDKENFKNVGKEIWVRFRPDCDGFDRDMDYRHDSYHAAYVWDPHYNLLKAVQKDRWRVNTQAIVFGDTRANLENTIHEWSVVDVMDNSKLSKWGSWMLTKSDFRKDYGIKYLGQCGEEVNPLSEGSFLVSGYNLTSNVKIAVDPDNFNEDAFAYTVEILDGYGTLEGKEIVPNQYGEVYAKVSVKFDPAERFENYSNVADIVTVEYDGRTIEEARRFWRESAEYDYVDYLAHDEGDVRFVYPMYDYPAAKLTGRIYKPVVNKVAVESIKTQINVPVPQTLTISGRELDPSKKSIVVSLVNEGTPYTISPSTFKIDADGNVNGELVVTFTPTSTADLCNNTNSLVYAYGTCPELPIEGSEMTAVTVVDQPKFEAFNPGDIQGDRVDLRVTPADGGNNYVVGIGILKYNKKTSSIFMSEVYAKDDKTYVELFNGTGEALNPDIISEDSPNYYMEVYEGTTMKKAIVLGAADVDLWKPYGITVKTIDYNLASNKEYTLVLKQGQITLDVYKFTGDVTHKTRKDDLDAAAYKVSAFNEADWTTVGGWHTSLTTQTPLYASMFHAEVPAANFKQYFDDVTVERAQYGFQTGLSV